MIWACRQCHAAAIDRTDIRASKLILDSIEHTQNVVKRRKANARRKEELERARREGTPVIDPAALMEGLAPHGIGKNRPAFQGTGWAFFVRRSAMAAKRIEHRRTGKSQPMVSEYLGNLSRNRRSIVFGNKCLPQHIAGGPRIVETVMDWIRGSRRAQCCVEPQGRRSSS